MDPDFCRHPGVESMGKGKKMGVGTAGGEGNDPDGS